MAPKEALLMYGGTGHHGFDARVVSLMNEAAGLSLEFSHSWYQMWPDGEPGFRLQNPEQVSGRHVVIFSCPITLKLEHELHDLVTAAKKQYGAGSVTVVLPFLPFRRQDRPEKAHEITRLRWFLSDLKHWGADKLVLCEPHSLSHTRQFAEEFGLPLYVGDPTKRFAEALKDFVQAHGGVANVKLYSPDMGSVGRALALARELGTTVVATAKQRANGQVARVEDANFMNMVYERYGADAPVSTDLATLRDAHVIMREDEVATGGTSAMTARYLREMGAKSVHLVATHPVCSPGWKMRLFPFGEPQPFDTVWFGNTRPRGNDESQYEGSTGGRVTEVDMAPVVAQTLIAALKDELGGVGLNF